MFTIPQILPADPTAPEHVTTGAGDLHYGVLARMILAFEGMPRVSKSLRPALRIGRLDFNLRSAALAR